MDRFYKIFMVVLGVTAFGTGVSQSQQDAADALFKKMKGARFNTSYRGDVEVKLFRRGEEQVFLKKVKSIVSQRYEEELILTEEQRERFEKARKKPADERNHAMQKRRMGRWGEGMQRQHMLENRQDFNVLKSDLLYTNYDVVISDSDPIADRAVTYMSINPKFEGRPITRLWVDAENFIVLRREIFHSDNPEGRRYVEEFKTIEFVEVTDGDRQLQQERRSQAQAQRRERRQGRGEGQGKGGGVGRGRINSQEFSSFDDVPSDIQSKIAKPGILPDGFVLDRVRIFEERGHVTAHQIYTDGLLLFQLFQSEGGQEQQFAQINRLRQSGRNGQRMNIMYKRDGSTNFILIGHVREDILSIVFDTLPGVKGER